VLANAWPAVGIVLIVMTYFVVVIGSIVLLIVAVVDIVKRPDWQWKIAGHENTLWLLLVILVNFLAIPALIYWFNVRKKLIEVEKAAATGQFGAGHMTYGGWEPTPFMPMAFASASPPNWQPDPSGQHRWRWWDGHQWTQHVSDGDTGLFPTAGSDSPDHS